MAVALHPERTCLLTDGVVKDLLRERGMSVLRTASPKDQILCRALSVANREFVYTIAHMH
jgi:hypothetical protein